MFDVLTNLGCGNGGEACVIFGGGPKCMVEECHTGSTVGSGHLEKCLDAVLAVGSVWHPTMAPRPLEWH